MAWNGGIHLQEILKLIENEGEVVGATEIQQLLKKLGKVLIVWEKSDSGRLNWYAPKVPKAAK